ncbi:AraC family transcriptional regulator [uncultured Roseobacter sp.]|uniref:helix-turn-helix transcriptional regulator n=1 Tax=uncultured Roseobacter sp. TaxID=114847 RepID=UPI0026345733|nr:AraC family transcriptional regulator [uncultured Roseobacter sp.]
MSKVSGFPHDLTPSRVASLDEAVEIKSLKTRGPVLGVGRMESIRLWPGMQLMRANMRGQAAYDAMIRGIAGLVVEVRLHGESRSREIGGPRRARLQSGSLEIAGCPVPAQWHVQAPAQEVFATVAVAYDGPFVEGLGDAAPELAARCTALMEREGLINTQASQHSLCIAQRLLDTDIHHGSAKLQLAAGAMDLLASAFDELKCPALQDDRMSFVRDYIAQNPGADVKIADVARAARMSPTTLKARFRSAHGRSIGAVMKERRLRLAQEMLENGCGVKDVAHRLQYSSSDSLTRALRQASESELSD